MTKLTVGYLFCKKHVTYQSRKWEIFEFVDYVVAISYENTYGNERCNILCGTNAGSYASIMNEFANEEELVFLPDNLNKSIEDNGNSVDFVKIRENKISKTAKYYLRKEDGSGLTSLVNNDFFQSYPFFLLLILFSKNDIFKYFVIYCIVYL